MITTREVNVDLAKEKLKLRRVTTKNVDASARVEPPKAKIKPRGVTTTTLADVADIREKKRRDDIAEEKKLEMMKREAEKEIAPVEIITAPAIVKDEDGGSFLLDEIGSPANEVEVEKKSWKEMTDAENKIEMKRRAAKGKATKARKKKEKEKEIEGKNKKD